MKEISELFDPQEFYALASELMAKYPQREAYLRTAISRAYYSALLQLRERIMQKRPDLLSHPRRETIHFRVRQALKAMGFAGLSGKLFNLYRLRGVADYETRLVVGSGMAVKAMSLAKDVMGAISRV